MILKRLGFSEVLGFLFLHFCLFFLSQDAKIVQLLLCPQIYSNHLEAESITPQTWTEVLREKLSLGKQNPPCSVQLTHLFTQKGCLNYSKFP